MQQLKNDKWHTVFLKGETPFWWNILSAIAGAFFVIWLVPWSNERFETRKIRTALIIEKLSDFQKNSNEILFIYHKYSLACKNDSKNDGTQFSNQLSAKKFEISVRATEVIPILKSKKARQSITSLQTATKALKLEKACPTTDEGWDVLTEQIKSFRTETSSVSRHISRSGT